MNFFRGRLADRKDRARRLRDRAGRELAPRPPDATPATLSSGSGRSSSRTRASRDGSLTIVPAEIEVTEQLGPETFAYFRVEGLDAVEIGDRPSSWPDALSPRLDPRTSAAPGERLNLAEQRGRLGPTSTSRAGVPDRHVTTR